METSDRQQEIQLEPLIASSIAVRDVGGSGTWKIPDFERNRESRLVRTLELIIGG